MKEKMLKIFLYISSFIPLYFLIIVKELIEIVNGNLSFDVTNTTMIVFNLLLVILGVIGVFIMSKNSYKSIEIVSVKNITRDDFLPYFPIFVLFAIAFELQFVSMAIVYVFILIMLGIVYIKNDMYYINPFLNIIGFCTYEVSYKQDGKLIKNKKLFSYRKKIANIHYTNGFILK